MIEVSYACKYGTISGLCWGKGNTKKLLALHGWLDNAASFAQLAPLLADNGYEVVAIDFAGHGHSDHRAPGHFCHFIDFVLDVQDVLKALNWQKPILLGHSMGAAMAQMYAASFPENISKLIMIENIGPVPYYEKGTAASNLKEALTQWQNHTTEHKHFYPDVKTAIKARIKVTPIKVKNLYPMVERGLRETQKGFHWRTDKRLRLRSPIRFSNQIVEDMLSSEKPKTQLILAEPNTYALNYKKVKQRIQKLNPDNFTKINGHHHLHMDNAHEVFESIQKFLRE